MRITVGMGSCGIASGAGVIYDNIISEVRRRKIKNIEVVKVGCIGICKYEPIVEIYNDDKRTTYINVKKEDISKLIEDGINNTVTKELVINTLNNNITEDNFYNKQTRIVLDNCGLIDPENINEYINRKGYEALRKVLTSMNGNEVIEEIKKSGLRGRGGAGFRTGIKWEMAYQSINDMKYVCCNADEGDPGAFMDRAILEGDPHSVIEAMIIAAYTIGAKEGYIYVRAEYPLAVERLKMAIKQAKEKNFLGKNIMGTDFSFDLDIRLGAGAFVCGEETALMASIEGKRGEPKLRPPFPTTSGLFNKPTLLNNVETYANVAKIILNGSSWFSTIGTENSKGTKVFALGGKINTTGLVEVPIGTSLKTIIYDIGGGIPGNKQFKAAQTGGPSGGCIPASLIDIKMDYEDLINIGSMMGSGGLIIMDEDTCMVDIAKFFLNFTVDESCGKCIPCRIGTQKVYEMLCNITEGKLKTEDLQVLEELSYHVKSTSFCGLGQSATNPVLSTLRYFKDEYVDHIENKKCAAKVCKNLIKYEIDKNKCVGCGLCARNCPVNAISGELKQPYEIDQSKCIKCGACMRSCKIKAINLV
jgi:NADP-reducing hydrogenase subunit HndC